MSQWRKKRTVTPDDEITESGILHYLFFSFSFPTAPAVKAEGGWQVWHYQYFHLLTSWLWLNCEGHCHRYLEIGSENEGEDFSL